MSRKIVAIGGGENGRIRSNGTRARYETKEIDLEIIRLTGKKNPNFLFLAHSQIVESYEESYFDTMKAIYGDMFGCECRTIKKSELKNNFSQIQELVDWADIIYEGGGDTKGMLELWRETGFDKILRNAWINGKVMCGVSAGANCWFKTCSSDSLKIQLNDDNAPLINIAGLNLINAFFTPHCNIVSEHTDRLSHMKSSLENMDLVGIGISNCCAIEIIDDQYRLITTDASNYRIEPYGIKTYWKDDKYIEEYIDNSLSFKSLDVLLAKDGSIKKHRI